jgi:GAF domain-containing protein/signal transduction histidine kinase
MSAKKENSHKILIVDDNKELRDSLELRLQVEGYDALAVATAREALQKMKTTKGDYDLVLMDQRLENPRAGIEATRKITKNWPETEVVVITGFGDREASIAAMKAGACRYVYKTGNVVNEIIDIVESLDDMRELERQLCDPNAERGWLQSIISDLGTGIVVMDRSYRVLYVNDEAKRLVDENAQVGGICWAEFYGANKQDEYCSICPVLDVFEERKPQNDVKISASGEKYIEISATPLKSNGKIIGAIKTVVDVTKREQLRQMESAIAGTLNLDERLEVILQGIQPLGYDRVRLYLLSSDRKALKGKVEIGGVGKKPFKEIQLLLDEDKYSENTLRKKKPFIYKGDEHGPKPVCYEPLDKGNSPWIDIPLLGEEKPIGMISVDNKHSKKPFDKSDLKRLMPFAGSATKAIETAREHEAIRNRALELEKLREIDAEITGILKMPDVLQKIAEICLELTGADSAGICHRKGERLVWVAGSGWFATKLGQEFRINQEHIPCVHAAKTGKQRLANQAQEDKCIILWKSVETNKSTLKFLNKIGSYFSYPLKIGEDAIGVLSLQSKKTDFFTEQVCAITKDFVSRATMAIENAQLFEAEAKRRQEADTLRETALILTTSLDQQEIFERILFELQKMVPYDSASIQLLKEEHLEIIGGRGFPNPSEIIGLSFPVDGDNPNREVIRSKNAFIVPDVVDAYGDFQKEPHAQAGIRSWLGVPMLISGHLIGMIAIEKRQPDFYTKEHAQLTLAFVAQAAIAIENARSYTAQQSAKEKVELLLNTVNTVANTHDLNKGLNALAKIMVAGLGVSFCHIMTLDTNSKFLTVKAAYPVSRSESESLKWKPNLGEAIDLSQDPLRHIKQHLLELPTPQVFRRGEIIMGKDVVSHVQEIMRLEGKLESILIISLKIGQKDSGFCTLGEVRHWKRNPFTDGKIVLANTMASQASVLIDRIQEWEIINEVGKKTSAKLNIQELLQTIVKEITKHLSCTHCTYFSPQIENGETLLAPRVTYGVPFDDVRDRRFKLGEGFAGWVFQEGNSLVIDDVRKDLRFAPPRRGNNNPWSMLVVPVKSGEQTIGVISANQDELNWFGEQSQRFVEMLASQAAIAIDNANLYQAEMEYGQVLKAIQETSTAVSTVLDQNILLPMITDAAANIFEVPTASLMLWDEAGENLVIKTSMGLSDEYVRKQLIPKKTVENVITSIGESRSLAISDLLSEPIGEIDLIKTEGLRSVLSTKLLVSDRLIGILNIYGKEVPRQFTSRECELAEIFANQAAIAIENAHLFETVKKQDKERLEYIQDIAHQLTGPLGGLRAHTDNLLNKKWSEERKQEVLQITSDLAGIVLRYATNFEYAARIGESIFSTVEFTPQLVNASELISLLEKHIQSYQGIARVKEIQGPTVDTDSFREFPLVKLDSDLFDMLMFNLYDNAIKYSYEGTPIFVRGETTTNKVFIEVINYGVPIRTEDTQSMFERYFRSQEAQKYVRTGTGIGLFVCRQIAERHDGKIEALPSTESELGHEVRIRITLPVPQL